jgi:hypothetical protein
LVLAFSVLPGLQDALEYGLIDEVIAPDAAKAEKAVVSGWKP